MSSCISLFTKEMDTLPFELVELILQRVPRELHAVLLLVCREWWELTPGPTAA